MFISPRNLGKLWLLGLTVATALIVGATVGCQGSHNQETSSSCPGSPIEPISAPQNDVEELALDVSISTKSASLRAAYEAAALASVNQIASKKGALRIIAFGASGVGAKVVFEGSFAPVSDDDVYNQAAQNRASCWAKEAIAQALATRTAPRDSGTDVAGATASLITDVRSLVGPGGTTSVAVFTDGCQAPAPSGPNHNLTDLCQLLVSGESPARILGAHEVEFSLGDARGVTITMKGIGVGHNQNGASTTFARKLVELWVTACHRANARTCEIGSAVS